jgi:DnaJ-class molecular chaperone
MSFSSMTPMQKMKEVISTWALAEKRAKHLCAFETLGLNIRCRKPNQEEVKKAFRVLCTQLHPDRNAECEELATEATRCINLAKQYLDDVHFG